MNVEKNEAIKNSLKETKERRKTQTPVVYELKLQNLTDKDIETLERLFLEAKWFRNFVVADITNRLNKNTWKLKEVDVKLKDKLEKREITHLGSQIKQEIVDRVGDDLRALHNSRAKGNIVGTLKFKSEVNSIPLKQYGITYGIDFKHNKVHLSLSVEPAPPRINPVI